MSVMHLRHHAPGPGARIMLSPVPWLWVLALSTSIAYAMTVALGGGPSLTPGAHGDMSRALAPAEPSATTAFFLDDDGGLACASPRFLDSDGGAGCGRWLPISVASCDTPVNGIDELIGATGASGCTTTVVW